MTWNEDWASKALCNQQRPDELFVRGAAQNRAKQLCAGCPVRTECLAEALDNQIEWGVWGGMTERERRALLRRRPNVTSWRLLLETAMEDHQAAVSASAGAAATAGRWPADTGTAGPRSGGVVRPEGSAREQLADQA